MYFNTSLIAHFLNVYILLSGILHPDGTINNDPSIARLAEIAVNYAKAGVYVCCTAAVVKRGIVIV